MKKFFESLRKDASEIINFEKKKLKLLLKVILKLTIKMQRFVKKNLKFVKDIKYCKVGDHCHYTSR